MKCLINYFDKKFYKDYSDNWDDILFRASILDHLESEHVLLDIGAGAGIIKAMNFKGLADKVVGIDPDPRVVKNLNLDEGYIGHGDHLPFDNNMFDIVFMNNVAEHLSNPKQVLSEIYRVTKPGGLLLFKTPNRFHYMPLIAMLTPLKFHRYFNRLRGRQFEDTFPTKYKVNSKGQVNKLAKAVGFESPQFRFIEGRPEYLRINVILYSIGLVYERIMNLHDIFERFRVLMICELVKPNK